jgi:hypothetical protein
MKILSILFILSSLINSAGRAACDTADLAVNECQAKEREFTRAACYYVLNVSVS